MVVSRKCIVAVVNIMIEMKGIVQKVRENARDSTPKITHSRADALLGVFLQPRYVLNQFQVLFL
jgi:hypothetical protein